MAGFVSKKSQDDVEPPADPDFFDKALARAIDLVKLLTVLTVK